MGSALLQLVLIESQRPSVGRESDLASVGYGWPLRFLVQDQSRVDPPFPSEARLGSLLENPTRVDLVAAAVDVLLMAVVLGAILALVLAAARQARVSREVVRAA